MIRSGKRRILSTLILALSLVAQPFAGVAYAATDRVTVCAVDCDYTDLQPALDGVVSGGTILLGKNIVVTSEIKVTKPVTIDGVGEWGLTAVFAKTDNDNNAAIGIIGTSGVTLKDMYINGEDDAEVALHGVNVYESTNVTLNNLNVWDMSRYGVVINSSTATIDSIITSGNGWGGVNVDTGTAQPAQVTMTGVSSHDEVNQLRTERAGVLVDNTTNTQYFEYPAGSGLYTTDTDSLGSVLNISTHKAFDSIQTALDHSSTVAGNVISLSAGDYSENVTVNKAVTINGPNAGINPVMNAYRNAEATLTGQISIFAGGVTVDGFTITNPTYNGPTIRGVHVWSSAGISGVIVKNNIFSNIANLNNKGSYAVMVQGAVSNVSVTNNRINGITSAGWAHAIEVTPASGVASTPAGTVVTGNSITGVTNNSGTDQYDFSVDSSGSVYANASSITFNHNQLSGKVRNLDTAHTLNASANWWGQTTGPTASQYSGDVYVAPWCNWTDCSTLATDGPLILPATDGVASVLTDTILDSTSTSDNVRVVLPAGTTVTADNSSWNGAINAPALTSYAVPGAASTGLALTVGSDAYSLTFDHAVQLYLPGQGGKSVGFKAPGGNFTEITTTCVANDPDAADAQLITPVNECKMTMGSDLIIWTKHFTLFAAYTNPLPQQNAAQSSGTSQSRTIKSTYASAYTYDDSWMEGAAEADATADKTDGTVEGDSAGVSSTSTVADATPKEIPSNGLAWYWWLMGAALAAGAWSLVAAYRNGRFNRS